MTSNNLKFFGENSWIKTLVNNSFRFINNGYYKIKNKVNFENHTKINLKKNLKDCFHVPMITELKLASPSKGTLIDIKNINLGTIVLEMEKAHSCGISILTQPYLFNGSIDFILKTRKKTRLPILMKDIIVSEVQI